VRKIKAERQVQRYEERFFFFSKHSDEAISTESQMFMGKNNIVTFVTPSFHSKIDNHHEKFLFLLLSLLLVVNLSRNVF